jgi:hypothetical protein
MFVVSQRDWWHVVDGQWHQKPSFAAGALLCPHLFVPMLPHLMHGSIIGVEIVGKMPAALSALADETISVLQVS